MSWVLWAQLLILLFLVLIFFGVFWHAYTKMRVKLAIIEKTSQLELQKLQVFDKETVEKLRKVLLEHNFGPEDVDEFLVELHEGALIMQGKVVANDE